MFARLGRIAQPSDFTCGRRPSAALLSGSCLEAVSSLGERAGMPRAHARCV